MNLLALDASTEACAVGIQTSEGKVFSQFEIAPRRHTELLLKMLDSVLDESAINKSQIDACIVGIGPGAFTGIRVGIATIQGIALGLNIPCYAVSSLQAIAQQGALSETLKSQVITACIDARMDEIYVADYDVDENSNVTLRSEELLFPNDEFQLSEEISAIFGTGVDCIQMNSEKKNQLITQNGCYPTAESLFHLFNNQTIKSVSPEQLQASYVRNNVTYQNIAKS